MEEGGDSYKEGRRDERREMESYKEGRGMREGMREGRWRGDSYREEEEEGRDKGDGGAAHCISFCLYYYHTLLLETITRISFSLQNCLTRSDRNLSRNLAVSGRLYTISEVFSIEGLYTFLIFQGESFIHSLVGSRA